MNLKTRLLPLLALIGCAVAPAQADPFLPVPPASFLNYHVSTARGLSEEVARDMVVRARLAHHFHMAEPAVLDYVRGNLVEARLTRSQAGRYRVACISPSGREYFVSEYLKAGTPVFALASTGAPILKMACGNPLVAVLPRIAPKPVKMKPAALAAAKALPAPVVAAPSLIPSMPVVPTPLVAPVIEGASPVVGVGDAKQLLNSGGKGFIPVVLGAATVGVLASHHGHNTPPPSTPPPGSAVPEANTLSLFALCGTALVGLGLRARRRRELE